MKSNKLAPKKAHGHMITIRMNYLRGNSLCKLKIFPAEWKKANVVPVYKKWYHIFSTQSSFKPSYYCINVFDVITHNIFKGFDDGLEEAFYLISLKLLTMHGMRDLSTNLSNWNL